MPKRQEVARLQVGHLYFEDWESVWVQHRYGDPYALFRFTAAEREPWAPHDRTALRFMPGDPCFIWLATDQLAMNGTILTRQVAYDATTHGVELQGKGNTWGFTKSSVDSQTGNFDNKGIMEVASLLARHYPIGLKFIGDIDNTPFKNLQNQPGEPNADFLERIARPRGVIIGSDHLGNIVLIGPHDKPVIERLVEGINILACQCIISVDEIYQKYTGLGQTNASDPQHGTAASEQQASVGGTDKSYSHKIFSAEQPVWGLAELQARVRNERLWHESAHIEAHITVHGWVMSNGQLWRIGDVVFVDSPMAALKQPLAIEIATFTQTNDGGSKTELKLVRPERLRIRARYDTEGLDAKPTSAEPGPTAMPSPFPDVPLAHGTWLTPSREIKE